MQLKLVIFDFNRTLFETESGQFYEGALSLLQELHERGIKLALWTRAERGRNELQQREGIAELFDCIYVSPLKDSESLRTIASDLGVPMECVVVVTDPVRMDMAAVNASGAMLLSIRQGKFATDIPYTQEEEPAVEVADIAGARAVLMQFLDDQGSGQ